MSQSVVLYGVRDLRIETQQTPQLRDDEVKIKIKSVGVCGTDVSSWKKGGSLGTVKDLRPLRVGHEPSGIIEEVGQNVTNVKPGDRVAVEPMVTCRECRFCKQGKGNMCVNHTYLGVYNKDGAMTEYHVEYASCCYKIPDSMSFDEGALVQPLSIAVGVCQKAKVSFGQKIVIGGTGAIGTITMMVAKTCGVSRICVTDILEERVNFALSHGADCGVVVGENDTPEEISQKIMNELGGYADVSIDCCGVSSNIESLMNATTPGGVLTLVGLSNGQMSAQNIVFKNLDVRGYFKTYNCYPEAIDLIEKKRVNVSCLISHRFPAKNFQEAFNNMCSGIGMKNIIYF